MKRTHWALVGVVVLCLGFIALYDSRPRAIEFDAIDDKRVSPEPGLHGAGREVQTGGKERSARPAAGPGVGARVAGRVLDEASGEPVAGARLIVFAASQELAKLGAVADEDGSFTLELSPTDAAGEIHCYARGYRPLLTPLPSSVGTPLVLRMERGKNIAGIVVDEGGEPVAGARVWAYLPGNWSAWPQQKGSYSPSGESDGATATTDATGRFLLEGLSEDRQYVIRCGLEGRLQHVPHATNLGGFPVARGGTHDLRLWLTTALDVELLAVDSRTGDPLAVAPTWLVAPPSGFKSETGSSGVAELQAARERLRHNATFSVRARAVPGDYTYGDSLHIMARALGYEPVRAQIALETIRGARHRVPFVPLHEANSYGALEVAPVIGGAPYRGWLAVSLSPVGGGGPGGASASRIDFSTQSKISLPLPAGRYMVRAHGTGPSGAWWPMPAGALETDVAAGSRTSLEIPLAGNPVAVRVQDASGRDRSGFDLQVSTGTKLGHWEGGWDLRFAPDSTARAVVWVPKGEVTIAALKGVVGYGTATVAADGSGKPLSVLIALDPDARPGQAQFVSRPR